ncbi:hypothetical protein [Pseudoxanthomonas wuyuanensis]|nr:hypothetical protein [Pseudoxanthomonas wuyuanensis]
MRCIHFSIGFALLASLAAGAAFAQQADQPPPPPQSARPMIPESRASRHNSLSDSVRRVRNETGGQVLSAERMQFDGRDINRVKYYDDRGRVRYREEADQSRRQAPSRPRRDIPSEPPARGDNPSNP